MPYTGYELHEHWHLTQAAKGFRNYCVGGVGLFIPGFWSVLDNSERNTWCVLAKRKWKKEFGAFEVLNPPVYVHSGLRSSNAPKSGFLLYCDMMRTTRVCCPDGAPLRYSQEEQGYDWTSTVQLLGCLWKSEDQEIRDWWKEGGEERARSKLSLSKTLCP
jgi:hypothetical protein